MTLPRYRAILDHWRRIPPLGVTAWCIAESLGAKKAAPRVRAAAASASADSTHADSGERAAQRQSLIELFGGTAGMALKREKRPEWMTQ